MVTESIPTFPETWVVHFGFEKPLQGQGNCLLPVSFEAKELATGRMVELSQCQLNASDQIPFPVDDAALIVVFDASKQIAGFLAKGWPVPLRILDLKTEFRCMTNGRRVPCGDGLPGALTYFGLDAFGVGNASSCHDCREAAVPGSARKRPEHPVVIVCAAPDGSVVHAVAQLLSAMTSSIDWPRALLRGAYAATVARMERTGIPIDIDLFAQLNCHWEKIRASLVAAVDSDYGVYDGLCFKVERFRRYLTRQGIFWPVLEGGQLDLNDEAFKVMSHRYPQLVALRELRRTLSQMRVSSIAIGDDGRNRCDLAMFASRTGRNQPSSSQFIFGQAVWVRGLIRPQPGHGLAYVDFSQQEFGIAAALSQDPQMMRAYKSGDPYIAFAKQAGAIPAWATKNTHPGEREQFKTTALAVQYGMGAASLAMRLSKSPLHAQGLLDLHRKTYKKFWAWSDAVLNDALLGGRLWTVFGWQLHTVGKINERSLRNFPMQANGAEVLRLTCIQLIADGIRLCAPIHDAVLIEAPLSELDVAVKHTQEVMRTASASVLGGFCLSSDANIIRYPDRYTDARGVQMWRQVMRQLALLGSGAAPPDDSRTDSLRNCLGTVGSR